MSDNYSGSVRIFASGNNEQIRKLCGTAHSADIAGKLSELPVNDIHAVISRINPHKAAHIFNYFNDSLQIKIAKAATDEQLAAIVDYLEPDEQADLIKRLDKSRRKKILKLLPEHDSVSASFLAEYPEGTAGSVMTRSFLSLPVTASVFDAKTAVAGFDDMKNLHYIFLHDKEQRVCAYFRPSGLINTDEATALLDISESEIISVRVLEDQEAAARRLERYDLLSIPVVDENGVIIGVITYDDAFEVIIREQTEDMQKIMAVTSGDADNGETYLNISVWGHFRKRITWIVALAVLGLVSGYILHSFEDVLSGLVILALYMPMLADTGGNTGSQSSTLVIRALALGDLKPGDTFRVIMKELQVSLLISVILMLLAYIKIVILSGGSTMPGGLTLSQIGIAISLALGIQVVSSTLIGAVLPIGVSFLKLDPAVIAAPAITSIVDITGLLIYFYTVAAMLGI